MRFDLHVHFAAEPPEGQLSKRLQRSLPFVLLRRTAARGPNPAQAFREGLTRAAQGARLVDKVVLLALDRPYSEVGLPLPADLSVDNRALATVCRAEPRFALGASVHPDRPDALEALDEAVALGAVLCKWLPNVQHIDPASPHCLPFYARLRALGLPLLSHTGDEHTLPAARQSFGNLARLRPALEAGVTVIAAHAGTGGPDRPADIAAFTLEYPRLFLDCSALWTPKRFRPMRALLAMEALRDRWVYGSDYPVPIFPPSWFGEWSPALRQAKREENAFDRRVLTALALGVPEAALERAASVCRG